jgi:hypothetical protein
MSRPHDYPEIEPLPREAEEGDSVLSVSHISGPAVDLWSAATDVGRDTASQLTLALGPDRSVVIGRQEGGRIEYLDRRYRPTQILPNTDRRVVQSVGNDGRDLCVSRGHFMLRGCTRGILFVNGVPRVGGGVRPPLNGTEMLAPDRRLMTQGEELLIDRGSAITIRLPNRAVLLLRAE